MTESKKLYRAMLCVIDSEKFSASDRLDILEVLSERKRVAEMVENHETKQAEGGEK